MSRFALWTVAAWGLFYAASGVWNTYQWVVDDFLDPGGPVRIINGLVMFILALALLSLCPRKDDDEYDDEYDDE